MGHPTLEELEERAEREQQDRLRKRKRADRKRWCMAIASDSLRVSPALDAKQQFNQLRLLSEEIEQYIYGEVIP